MLALVVELLVTALIGANFGFEASSFFVDEGNRPGIGQAFLVIDPDALAGREAFLDRLEVLVRRDARRTTACDCPALVARRCWPGHGPTGWRSPTPCSRRWSAHDARRSERPAPQSGQPIPMETHACNDVN